MINVVKVGDYLSEQSHYKVVKVNRLDATLFQVETGTNVVVTLNYIKEIMNSAGEITTVVKVTKEDRRDGTPGIRSIFESINGSEVFTVCFTKQNKKKSNKEIAEEQAKVRQEAKGLIERAKKNKKSMSDAYEEALAYVQAHPILDYIPGRRENSQGYKTSPVTRDGYYECMDLEKNELRKVNINTIKWIIYKGFKYVLE